MTVLLYKKRALWRHGLLRLYWKNSSGLHRTPFGMNRSTDCTPDLLTQHHNALVGEWAQTPTATLHNLEESRPRRVEIILTLNQDWICSVSTYDCDGQASINLWPYSGYQYRPGLRNDLCLCVWSVLCTHPHHTLLQHNVSNPIWYWSNIQYSQYLLSVFTLSWQAPWASFTLRWLG